MIIREVCRTSTMLCFAAMKATISSGYTVLKQVRLRQPLIRREVAPEISSQLPLVLSLQYPANTLQRWVFDASRTITNYRGHSSNVAFTPILGYIVMFHRYDRVAKQKTSRAKNGWALTPTWYFTSKVTPDALALDGILRECSCTVKSGRSGTRYSHNPHPVQVGSAA